MVKRFRVRFLWIRSDNRKSEACPEPGRRIKNVKWVGLFAIVVALEVCGARSEAQQLNVPRIGYLLGSLSSAGDQARSEAFR